MKYHQSTQYVTIPRDEELSTQRTESVDDDDAAFTRRSEKYSY
jgi:hypothetical protein